ncbi:hypothetical protein [Algoriphagus sp. AK58]|uniref:hypothetical protein n=1 Tax=Algoriphagus sp. AK58 TaxID=1406877 RepID=UPI0016500958|nr:hypothetical protein [Algoriphagus sp. AK58]MBC6366204.1 hypothetical protein [Algoriphagus sp. AK58]
MLITQVLFAQTETKLSQKLELRGYLKDLQSLTFNRSFDSLVTGNLIHNRLNLKWNPSQKIRGAAEFRTRLFWGEEVKYIPEFSSGIRNPNEWINASVIWFETESMLMQTYVDRFWLEYQSNAFEIRLGRQRINWGIGTIWNPNDIFNTYNFLDFDYEERPGRDAVKAKYHLTEMSSLEIAASAADQSNKAVVAAKYNFNKYSYDFQFSAGVYQEILTLGTGWSGSIGQAGFKGEIQYYAAHRDTTAQLNLTMESDYVFEKGWYLNLGFLLNSKGIDEPIENISLFNFQLSPQNLMPTKWNGVFTTAKQFTPLFSGQVSLIYAPGTHLLLVLPSLQYNLATNLDVDFTWQSFYAKQSENFQGVIHRGFLRMKWSF